MRKAMALFFSSLPSYKASAATASTASPAMGEKAAAPAVTTGGAVELGSVAGSEVTAGGGAGMTVPVAS